MVMSQMVVSPTPASPDDESGTPRASASPAMSGRYRLKLTFGPSCLLGSTSATVVLSLVESAVPQGLEVEGTTASSADALVSHVALLRQSSRIHGAMGVTGPSLGVTTAEGRRVWMQIRTDGAVDTSGASSPKAQGTAFGEVMMSRAGDDASDTLGSCSARDHVWSLEPF